MGRKISKGNIPQWFKLEDYAYLSSLGASGWARVLQKLLHAIDYPLDEFLKDVEDPEMFGGQGLSRRTMADRLISSTLRNAFTENPADAALLRIGDGLYKTDPSSYAFTSVWSLTNHAVARMAMDLDRIPDGRKLVEALRARDEDRKNLERGKRTAAGSANKELLDGLKVFSATPFFLSLRDASGQYGRSDSLPGNRAIAINMALPDDMILENFREWLGHARKLEFHQDVAGRQFRSADYAKWFDDGYVPLILLDKWQEMSGVKITNQELAVTLFPNRRDVDQDTIRRTIRKQATSWADWSNQAALTAQAAKELAGKVSGP